MNAAKLKRTIEREFKRNPGKTCVLLGLLPVAAYFILPLVWQTALSSKRASKPATTEYATSSAAVVPAITATTGTTAAKAAAQPEIAWHELAAGIAADPRMTSAPVAGSRNPFQVQGIRLEVPENKPEQEQVAEIERPDARPEDLGLQLSATIVGNHLRLATINGKQYRENARVAIPSMHLGQANGFVLKTVSKKFVVLERDGKLYRLQLAR